MTEQGGSTRGRMVYIGIGLAFALLLLGYVAYRVSTVVLLLLLTMLFSIILSAPVDYLERRGLGRGWGTLIVLGGTALALYLLGLAFAPTVEMQARQFIGQIPSLISEMRALLEQLRESSGVDLGLPLDTGSIFEAVRNALPEDLLAAVADIGGSIVNAVSLAVVVLVATVYLVLNPRPLVRGFVALFPAGRRPRVREILLEMYHAVQRWLLGQLTSMTIIGVSSAIALSIIGIPFAILLGLISGLVSFVPLVGPVISVIPPTLLALANDPIDALWVIGAYIVIQQIESNLIQPMVMSRAVSLHPAVVVFALLAMGTLFGLIGVILAMPLVAALHVLVDELWIKNMNQLGTDPEPPPKTVRGLEVMARMRRLWRAAKALRRS